ncbi:hypothetical protein NQ314_007793 [Rhamnusium bicolor]|uniref:Uncharacterized protein n=1 Tax=Rhamnusium bicolor TaxID=1586634 RepID=A0AAV8YHD0_9CUCU|nr:hypothetical protein NQ314_007793 [Rhamnusium bicolor]
MKDHVHMKFAKALMTILGIWPIKLTGYKLKLYNVYFYISFTYYILYDISQGAMVFITTGNFVETAGNLGVTIIYVINIYKVLICRSEDIKKIIHQIEVKEKLIMEHADEKIKEIYHEHVKSALLSASFYVSLGSIGISLYFITPVVKNIMEIEDEHGFKQKHLIFSSWFPFDSNKHYGLAYIIQFFGGFYGYAYIVYAGAFFFCILKYCIGQIKILQHIFKNLNHYIVKFSEKNPLIEEQSHQLMYTKLCIKEHQHIIE